ncbi:MAG: restriction endonuclease subunit S [Sulfuricurvum sp.]
METIAPEGHVETKLGFVPKDWNIVKLRDIAIKCNRKNTDESITTVFSNSALNGVVLQNEYFDKDVAQQGNLDGYYIVQMGDFVYNPRISQTAPAGPINRNLKNQIGVVSPLYTVFRIKTDEEIKFIEHFFKSTKWLKYMMSVANYGARHDRMNITSEDLFNMPIPFPKKEERAKIAQILTTCDEAITKQEELIKEKEQLKKGLMQKLLSGKVRFDGFTDAWKETKLGDIGKFYKGKGISKDEITEQGIPCIRYGELYTIYGEKIDQVVSKTNIDLKELFLSKKNDVVIPASGETALDIATASCVLHDDIALGSDLNVIRTKQNGVFLSYYLNKIAKKRIAAIAQGVSVVHLYSSQLSSLILQLPSLEEQQKIAECLSLAADEINLLKGELEELKQQKKGLMQKLLTGEVRVRV